MNEWIKKIQFHPTKANLKIEIYLFKESGKIDRDSRNENQLCMNDKLNEEKKLVLKLSQNPKIELNFCQK